MSTGEHLLMSATHPRLAPTIYLRSTDAVRANGRAGAAAPLATQMTESAIARWWRAVLFTRERTPCNDRDAR